MNQKLAAYKMKIKNIFEKGHSCSMNLIISILFRWNSFIEIYIKMQILIFK